MPVPNTPNYYAVANPMFQRAMRNILSITNGYPALVTTTLDGIVPGDHQYMTGLIARINIPLGFGMAQLNQFEGIVAVTSSTQFTIDIDTTSFDAFIVPTLHPGWNATPATVVPVGEINGILSEATQNILLPI